MKIKNVAIKNFRGYSDEINSDFEDLTAFVGKNDIGKSTILEALDIFFNDGKGVTKLDKADLNVESKARQETDISIRVCFTDLPEKIVIDTTNETSLSAEYKQGKTTVSYKKINTNGTTREQQICMTEYIRHQIHHPENTYNARFNDLQLRRSIEDMRAFVTSKAQTPETT